MLASSIKIVTEPPNSTLTRGTTPQLKSFFPKLMTQALKHFNPLIYSFAIMHALTRGRTLRIQDYHLQTRDKLQLAGGVRNAERSINHESTKSRFFCVAFPWKGTEGKEVMLEDSAGSFQGRFSGTRNNAASGFTTSKEKLECISATKRVVQMFRPCLKSAAVKQGAGFKDTEESICCVCAYNVPRRCFLTCRRNKTLPTLPLLAK